MQTFSLPCFSSSNRGGGVAPDCVEFALRCLFPWLQAPFCFRSAGFSHPEWVASHFNKNKANDKDDNDDEEAATRRRRRILSERVHLFNSGLLYHRGTFFILFRLSYFPLAFRLFPPWGINQNLSERKIKTRPYWIWSGFVLYSMHGY